VYNFYQGLKKALGFCLSKWVLGLVEQLVLEGIPKGWASESLVILSVHLDKQAVHVANVV